MHVLNEIQYIERTPSVNTSTRPKKGPICFSDNCSIETKNCAFEKCCIHAMPARTSTSAAQ